MGRVGTLLALASCLVLASARPAAAHGAGAVEATNYVAALDRATPLDGVRLRILDADRRLELRNDGAELVVLGNDDEPYLRIGPDGAFVNRQSPTADLNGRDGHDPAATGAGNPQAAPDWRKLSDAPVASWHHHGIHEDGPHEPPGVEARPGQRQVVSRWEVALQRGSQGAVASGTLTWVPGPSPARWLALLAATALGVGALGLLRRWGPPLAAVTAVVLTVDLVHAASLAFAFSGGLGSHLGRLATGSFYAIAGWVLAAVAIRLLRRNRVDGLYAGVFTGLSSAAFGGLLDLAVLSRSSTPFLLPIGAARLCVTIAAGGGLGLAAACLLVIRRTPEARRVVGGVGGLEEPAPRP